MQVLIWSYSDQVLVQPRALVAHSGNVEPMNVRCPTFAARSRSANKCVILSANCFHEQMSQARDGSYEACASQAMTDRDRDDGLPLSDRPIRE